MAAEAVSGVIEVSKEGEPVVIERLVCEEDGLRSIGGGDNNVPDAFPLVMVLGEKTATGRRRLKEKGGDKPGTRRE